MCQSLKRNRDGLPRLVPELLQHPLDHRQHILDSDEGGLEVDLGELGLPVGTEVLIPEAARDLEVAVEAGDHQQLLVNLR